MSNEPENANDPEAWKRALEEHIDHLKFKEEEYNHISYENAIKRDLTKTLRMDLEHTLYKRDLTK